MNIQEPLKTLQEEKFCSKSQDILYGRNRPKNEETWDHAQENA